MLKKAWVEKPLNVLLVIVAIVFIAEFLIMLTLSLLQIHIQSIIWDALLDAILLSVISALLIWVLVVRPLSHVFVKQIRKQKTLQHALELNSLVFELAREGVIITDAQNRILKVNRAFTETTGFSIDDVIGKNPNILSSREQPQKFYEQMWAQLEEKGFWQGEVVNCKKSGEYYNEWLSVVVVKNKNGKVRNYLAVFSDITERKRAEEIIQHQALHDSLTDLPNRRLFEERLGHSIQNAKREKASLAIFFMDLDLFKRANDQFGHDVGDMLLRKVSLRLQSCIREVDTLSRFGGDEFALILEGIHSFDDARKVAQKISKNIQREFNIAENIIQIGISIGISIYPDSGKDVASLIKSADRAMYFVKENQKGTFKISSELPGDYQPNF